MSPPDVCGLSRRFENALVLIVKGISPKPPHLTYWFIYEFILYIFFVTLFTVDDELVKTMNFRDDGDGAR
jgi:hypothetical protein